MQYKCNECNDTGSRDKIGAYFDCNACDTATTRRDLNDFVKSLTQRSTYPVHPEDVALAIHQRALAMAPKQEVSGKYLNNEEVKQLVAALAMGADNTEALRSEAPRRLIAPLWAQSDCIAAALRIFQDFPAAPAAANGAPELPREECRTDMHIDGKGQAAYTADQMRTYGQVCHAMGRGAAVREYVESGTFKQPVAAAGPDAALVTALEGTANLLASLGMDSSDEYQSARAALSGAKGN